jgi:hypothetical protein
MQQATIQAAAVTQGHALLVGEARKLAAHADACQAVGVSFIPVVLETLGGLSASAVSVVACLGQLLGQRMGISPADSTRHLFQRCAIYFPLEGQCCPLDSAPSYTCPLSRRGPLTALIFNVRSVFIMCVFLWFWPFFFLYIWLVFLQF